MSLPDPTAMNEQTLSEKTNQKFGVMQKRADFLKANRGQRHAAPGFVILDYARADDDPAVRLGITITKKVGNAVVRNRMRRRYRELARNHLARLGQAGHDYVLIGRDRGIERDFTALSSELERGLQRLADGLFDKPRPPRAKNQPRAKQQKQP